WTARRPGRPGGLAGRQPHDLPRSRRPAGRPGIEIRTLTPVIRRCLAAREIEIEECLPTNRGGDLPGWSGTLWLLAGFREPGCVAGEQDRSGGISRSPVPLLPVSRLVAGLFARMVRVLLRWRGVAADDDDVSAWVRPFGWVAAVWLLIEG